MMRVANTICRLQHVSLSQGCLNTPVKLRWCHFRIPCFVDRLHSHGAHLKMLVDQIRDEHHHKNQKPEEQLRRDARIDLDELNEIAGTHLQTDDFDFETLGGLIFHLAGEIPATGDSFRHHNLQINVERVENHRIVSVIVEVEPEDEMESVDRDRTDKNAS